MATYNRIGTRLEHVTECEYFSRIDSWDATNPYSVTSRPDIRRIILTHTEEIALLKVLMLKHADRIVSGIAPGQIGIIEKGS